MAFQVAPTVSDKIHLSDMSDEFSQIEGDCAKEDRVWAIFRQATEADNLRREQRQETVYEWSPDGSYQEVRSSQQRADWAYEIYLTLVDCGNLTDRNGKPLFTFVDKGDYNGYAGSFSKFKDAYGKLPASLAFAMIRACYEVNPDWDWMGIGREEGEENPTSEDSGS